MRLTLFAGQQAHQLITVRLDGIRHFGKAGAAFFHTCFLPFGKRGTRCGDGFVQFGLTAIGHLPDHLFVRRVYDINPFAVVDQFAADKILILRYHGSILFRSSCFETQR